MSKITNLPGTTTLADDDVVYVVDVSEGTNGSRKIKKSDLKENVALTASEVKTRYESNANTNAFTDAEKTKLAGVEPNAKDDQIASEVPFDNTGTTIASSDVQGAIGELEATLDAHLTGPSDKHIASRITYERADVDKKSIQTGSDSVEDALTDLDDRKVALSGAQAMTGSLNMGSNSITNVNLVDGRDVSVDGAKLDTIEANAKDDQTALEVPYSNTGTIFTATNVQNAITDISKFFEQANEVVVSKNPAPGHFSTITAALNSITDASSLNRYVVRVRPGTYVEPSLQMKPFVALIGSAALGTTVQVNDPADDVIIGANEVLISDIALTGSTALGSSAISLDSITPGVKRLIATNIALGQTNVIFKANADDGEASFIISNISITDATTFDKMMVVTSSGAGISQIKSTSMIIEQQVVPFPSTIFDASGTNSSILVGNAAVRIVGGSVVGAKASNGAEIKLVGVSLNGLDKGILVENVGAGPKIRASSLVVENSFTRDVEILHPDTTGFIMGAVAADKLLIDSSADLQLVAMDTVSTVGDNTGLVIVGDILQGKSTDQFLNFSQLSRESATMGLLSGGVLSSVTGLTINVSSGVGFAVDPVEDFVKKIIWSSTDISLAQNSSLFIFVNFNGIVSSSPSLPNLEENILLGKVATLASSIDWFDRTPSSMVHSFNDVDSFARSALGPIFASGSVVTENQTTGLQLDVSGGEYWLSTNRFQPSGGQPIEFTTHHRDGLGGFTASNTKVQTLNNTKWDDGSGTLANLSAGFYAKHSLYLIGDGVDEQYLQVYPQAEHSSLAAAETSPLPLAPSIFTGSVVLIASIVVQEGNPNIVSILDERPFFGASASAVTSTSDHGSLSGLSDDDHAQYFRADGQRAMVGNINVGGNNITNVGTVDGVDVSAHKNRHLPNGADPLDTAAPTTNLSGATSNSVGTANSFARSDHTHVINNATTSVGGLLSAADKTKLNGIEPNAKDDQLASEVPYSNTTSGLTATTVQGAIDEVEGRVDTAEANISGLQTDKQDRSEKGQANGYASLDSAGKVPVTQLPNSIMEYQGTWNAATNTPTLADGSGNNAPEDIGDVYRVNNAGTADLGSGPISFEAGDYVILSATFVWEKADTTDAVSSVFGRQGEVTAQVGDYTASQVTNVAAGNIAATNVQTALNELDSEKLARSGVQAMTGNLDMGANSITNVNLVDGVDVSLHGTRHNPDGADPAATGSPVTISDSTNSNGTADSFVRSDHVHAHGNRGGGTLHANAIGGITPVAGFISGPDKVKLDTLAIGHLSYSNNSLQSTTSTTFVNITVDVDRESFANSLITKVSGTDFRAEFNGQVEISYAVGVYAGANDRAVELAIQRNSNDLVWTVKKEVPRGGVDGTRTVGGTFVLNCAVGDVFRLRWRAPNGDTQSINPDRAYMSVKVYRIS